MDFEEKIYNVLKYNKLGIATKEDLAEFCGFHRDTIRKAIERKSELKDKYLRIFQDKLSINPEWWDRGKGDVFLKNGTDMQKPTSNKEILNGDVYRKVLEALDEKYRYVSLEQYEKDRLELENRKLEIQNHKLEIEKNEAELIRLHKQISDLTAAIIELKRPGIPSTPAPSTSLQ